MSGLISVDEALTHIRTYRPLTKTVNLPLVETLGLRLAEDIHAKLSQPPADVSAMDGYAVRLSDVSQKGTSLSVIGEAPAGTPFQGTFGPGQAVRIFTGGQVPAGADHIVIQENVLRSGDEITLEAAYDTSAHIRTTGRDFRVGDRLIMANSLSLIHI